MKQKTVKTKNVGSKLDLDPEFGEAFRSKASSCRDENSRSESSISYNAHTMKMPSDA